MLSQMPKLQKAITALLVLFFVAYCTLGICTNLVASMAEPAAISDTAHQHHTGQTDTASAHCDQERGCEWRNNLLPDFTLDHNATFFVAYLISGLSLLLSALTLRLSGQRHYAFARQLYFLRTYPRLHLQKAVFLN